MSKTITETVQKTKIKRRRRVTWTEDTVDNEHMNRKKSKICCIHHRNKNKVCKSKNKYERG